MKKISIAKVLVPVDLSPKSIEAADYAQAVAKHFGAELIVLNVLEPLPPDFAMADPGAALMRDFTAERRSERQAALEAIGRGWASEALVRRMITQGDPAEQIIACAHDEGVDLVVMPTQGHSRVRQFLIGSVTAKVLHDAEAPVLTGVHLEQIQDFPEFGVKQILCAVDMGKQSESVLAVARDLASHFNAKATILHVFEDSGNAKERVSQLAQAAQLEADVLVEAGEPHKVVTSVAERLAADLVIIGRGASSGVIGRLRAQAYNIVRQSPCPVLSV